MSLTYCTRCQMRPALPTPDADGARLCYVCGPPVPPQDVRAAIDAILRDERNRPTLRQDEEYGLD